MGRSPMIDDRMVAGRAALSRGAWSEARSCFEAVLASAAPSEIGAPSEIAAEAHEGLSWSAWWQEDVEACLAARERAYRGYRGSGDHRSAARMALWLGDDHLEFRRASAVAAGWFSRAERLLETLEPCPEHGWLTVFRAHDALGGEDAGAASELAREARELGREHGAVDLEMFGLATEGVALMHHGEVARGLRCLDEATTAALAGEFENLAPAAWTCCLVMSACERVRDHERGAQWCERIEAFSRRMDARFVTGVCRVHHAAILTSRGDWDRAEQELSAATHDLTEKRPTWRSEALVRLADLRHRQGLLPEARELFTQASDHPLALIGLARIHLDQGDPAAAIDLLERALRRISPASIADRAGTMEPLIRAQVAVGDLEAAARHLDELGDIAQVVATEPLSVAVSFAHGLVAAANHDHARACDRFEDAIDGSVRSRAPLEEGRARVELARSLSALGRDAAAQREAQAASDRFEELGATAECQRAREVLVAVSGDRASGRTEEALLTPRQTEILRMIAQGLGDKDIAARLVLSEHTVHRHVANIHLRLACSTRAEAVARALRLGLL